MPDTDNAVREIILNRLDRLEQKIDHSAKETDNRLRELERRVNWAFAFVSAMVAVATATGQKIYSVLFGAYKHSDLKMSSKVSKRPKSNKKASCNEFERKYNKCQYN